MEMDIEVTNESHVESYKAPNESPTSASEADQQNNTNVSIDSQYRRQVLCLNGNEPAQRRLHSLQAQQQLLKRIENIRQQHHPADVQSLLEQQQHQLQLQQQQQFLLWLQEQQREQQQQNKQNSERLERLEKMVHEMASMIKQWRGDRTSPQLHSNALASQ
ncbi:uncharacterized protein DDB_G0274935-like [Drosophila virilis]|uniref:uncharacterized protein DDB_G0274935-like n=1 Tax=Drosophila virilis TaxID=7244 RepID=UPI00017D5FCD